MKNFLVVLALFSFQSFGQTGLYGKRSIVEIQGIGSMPIIYNWFNGNSTIYKRQGDNLVDGSNLLEYGLRANVMRAFSNQIGVGIEFGYERQSLAAPEFIDLNTNSGSFSSLQTFSLRHEKIRLNTVTIMPKIEISTRSNLLPIGLSHQVGFGYTRVTVDDRDYLYTLDNPNNQTILTPIDDGFIDMEDVYTGFTLMYQINMRTPITEQLVLSYGIRYNANFVRATRPIDGQNPTGEFNFIDQVRDRRNPAFIQLNIGLGFAF